MTGLARRITGAGVSMRPHARGGRAARCLCTVAIVLGGYLCAGTVGFAQTLGDISIGGFADAGARSFTAANSFETILGSAIGPVFGGGGEVRVGRIFGSVRVSWFRKTGDRVFIHGGEVFRLDIPATVTVMPIELTGGYRFDTGRRLVPYAGGGVGWHRYEETSSFALADEDVSHTTIGYHALGGVEFRISRWLAIAGEAQWSRVPDALGRDPLGVSAAFGESDLGGVAGRVKVVFGR